MHAIVVATDGLGDWLFVFAFARTWIVFHNATQSHQIDAIVLATDSLQRRQWDFLQSTFIKVRLNIFAFVYWVCSVFAIDAIVLATDSLQKRRRAF